jgi:outer membrane protein TolC
MDGVREMKSAFSILLTVTLLPAPLRALTLEELQQTALAENPRLRAMAAEVKMTRLRVGPGSSPEDPKLRLGLNNLSVDNPALTAEEMTSLEIGVSQMLTLWGKLGLRERIALARHRLALERFRQEKIETLHRVRSGAYELQYLASSRALLDDIKKQLKLVISSEVTASKAGTGSLSAVIKANVEYAMIDEEVFTLEQRVREERKTLRYLVAKDFGDDTGVQPEPSFDEPDAVEVKRNAAASNPELAAARINREIAESELSLKKRDYFPDVELGLSYMYRKDTADMRRSDMVSGMATMSVPAWFWKKNMPMVDEMSARDAAARDLVRDKSNEIDAKAYIIIGRMKRAKELFQLYKTRIIPQTELSLETSLARYRTGSVEFMPVIDGVRMLLRFKKELLMAEKEYRVSYSELHALMGREVLP